MHVYTPERLSCPQVQNLQGQLRQTGQGLYGQAQGMRQGLQGQLMQTGQGLYGQAQSMGGGLQNQLRQTGQGLYGQAQSMGQGAFQQGMNLGNQLQQQGQNAFRQGAGMAQGLQGAFYSKVKSIKIGFAVALCRVITSDYLYGSKSLLPYYLKRQH